MSVPTELGYTAEHEWVSIEDGVATVGITAFAAESLGDIVYVDLPSVGQTVTAGAVMGEIESTKSVSELYAPVSGTVTEINEAVVDDPALVNSSPFEQAWLIKVTIADGAADDLLDRDAYVALTEG